MHKRILSAFLPYFCFLVSFVIIKEHFAFVNGQVAKGPSILGPKGEVINASAPLYVFNQNLTVTPNHASSAHSDYTFTFTLNRDYNKSDPMKNISLCASVDFTDFFGHSNITMKTGEIVCEGQLYFEIAHCKTI